MLTRERFTSYSPRLREEIIASFKKHPAIAPLVDGADLKEYSAHVIPEAGFKMFPKLVGPGLLVAGDAAAMCLAAGIWLEGVNFAMGSGMYAGRAAAQALTRGNTDADGLKAYLTMLQGSFVFKDHQKLQHIPHLVLSDRVQQQYPSFIANLVERMFRVDNPAPKPGLRRILREERKRAGIRWRDLLSDGWTGMKGFG